MALMIGSLFLKFSFGTDHLLSHRFVTTNGYASG